MSACPECGQIKTQVLESRVVQNGWTKRRRFCFGDCQHQWITFEIPDTVLSVSDMHEDDLKEFPRQRRR